MRNGGGRRRAPVNPAVLAEELARSCLTLDELRLACDVRARLSPFRL